MLITPLYAAIFAIVLFVLSVRTLRLRRRFKVAIGPGEQPELQRAMRVHANFCEYVPITILLIFFLETLAPVGWWIHSLCAALLLGRALHAWGVSQVNENLVFRVAGMATTFTVMLSAAFGILAMYALG
ncbi:MAG: MAPEG family protein [Woeseiaceae bacterium]|nr:MAPEG family protein [Woeseiaceae bacterium]